MKKLPTTDAQHDQRAANSGIQHPKRPEEQVRTKATPTDFCGASTTMFVLP